MIDTSSRMALFKSYPKKQHKNIWTGVDALIARRVIRSPRIVYDEIAARQDGLLSWLGTRQQIFAKPNADVLNLVVQINSEHPLLVNRNKSKRGADPHVIELAVRLRQQGLLGLVPVIVTEEADIPGRITKTPYIARQYGASCIKIDALLGREGIGQ